MIDVVLHAQKIYNQMINDHVNYYYELQNMNTEEKIVKHINRVTELLIRKNKAYGNSATSPKNVFAKGDAVENIGARIDDKLCRIQNAGISPEIYDTIDDLIGYLILMRIAIEERDN